MLYKFNTESRLLETSESLDLSKKTLLLFPPKEAVDEIVDGRISGADFTKEKLISRNFDINEKMINYILIIDSIIKGIAKEHDVNNNEIFFLGYKDNLYLDYADFYRSNYNKDSSSYSKNHLDFVEKYILKGINDSDKEISLDVLSARLSNFTIHSHSTGCCFAAMVSNALQYKLENDFKIDKESINTLLNKVKFLGTGSTINLENNKSLLFNSFFIEGDKDRLIEAYSGRKKIELKKELDVIRKKNITRLIVPSFEKFKTLNFSSGEIGEVNDSTMHAFSTYIRVNKLEQSNISGYLFRNILRNMLDENFKGEGLDFLIRDQKIPVTSSNGEVILMPEDKDQAVARIYNKIIEKSLIKGQQAQI